MKARRGPWLPLALAALSLAAILLSGRLTDAPDGLEATAADLGLTAAEASMATAPAADYRFPGLGDGPFATFAAGLAGTVLVFLAAGGAGRLLARRRRAP